MDTIDKESKVLNWNSTDHIPINYKNQNSNVFSTIVRQVKYKL
jgi:hypothetical protein